MQSLPAIKPVIKEAKSRYDEFQAYHINKADAVHLTARLSSSLLFLRRLILGIGRIPSMAQAVREDI